MNTSGEIQGKQTSRELLNQFLASRDVSPVRNSLTIPWDKAAERTKRYYTRKAQQVVSVALEEIAPESSEMLLTALKSKSKEDRNCSDSTLLEELVECYTNTHNWSTRRQMLSIMADKVSFKVLQSWIPDLQGRREAEWAPGQYFDRGRPGPLCLKANKLNANQSRSIYIS